MERTYFYDVYQISTFAYVYVRVYIGSYICLGQRYGLYRPYIYIPDIAPYILTIVSVSGYHSA